MLHIYTTSFFYDSNMVEIHSSFVPKNLHDIPLIDLSEENTDQLVSQISQACKTWGFFQVINHGVSSDLRKRVEAVAKKFFDQPMEDKLKVKRDMVRPFGYHDSEHTKNVRDWKELFDYLVVDPTRIYASPQDGDDELRMLTNQWPQNFAEFREACEEYAQEINKLFYKLLRLVSLSLGLQSDRLNDYFKEQLSFLRLNHYPPCPTPDLALGVGPHKDAGALTVLAQDNVGGLQVRRKSDRKWINVEPVLDAYIINVGDAIQVWSNDIYESVEHRAVVNTVKERFSVPFFFIPSHDAVVKPLDELVSEKNPARYQEYRMGKFIASRNRSDYKKLNVENIQIDHFRISV